MAKSHAPEGRSRPLTLVLWLAVECLTASAAPPLVAQGRPDFTGTWKLRTPRPRYSEVWTIKQTDRDIGIRMDIVDDQLGDRTLDFRASLDGTERKQTVIGTSASVRASWDGDVLVVEIKRQARPDLLLHNRRWLRLAGGGKRMESRTMQYSPPPAAERDEVFDRR